MRTKLSMTMGLAGVLALTLVACGSSSTGDTPKAVVTATGNQPTGEPIKVMVIVPLSGPSEAFTDIPPAAKAAVAAINKAGGVKGRPFEVTICDDQFDPNKAADCATQAVSGKYLFATGVSPNGDRYMPILEKAKIPVVGATPNSASELKSPYSYPFLSGVIEVAGGGTACGKLGKKTPGVAVVDIAAGRNSASLFDVGLKPYNLPAPKSVFIPPTATDFTTYAANISSADCVEAVLGGASFERLTQAMRQAGNNATVAYGSGQVSQQRIDRLGAAATGMVLVAQNPAVTDTTVAAVKKFHDESVAYGTAEKELTDEGLVIWGATHLVAELAAKLTTIDGENLAQALNAAGDIDYPPLAKVNFAKPVPLISPDNRIFSTDVQFSEVKDGKRVPLFDGKTVNVLNPS
ncbi:ABC transporter substrate-binding protein [Frankia sp. Cas4]|uniref:ABC transporter substrate-binding protein n=1 Tax=Frankia sp. Cas4 TaxID=3073927 RepID=UPI002AD52CD3|nr:ABC transporter substrate-binding protein [Frankia sp. Cas4]